MRAKMIGFWAIGNGFLIIAIIQTVGAVVELPIRGLHFSYGQVFCLWSWVLAGSFAWVANRKGSTPPTSKFQPWLGSCAVAGVLLCLSALLVPFFFSDFKDDYGISINSPSATIEDCYKSRGCHTYRTDRFGFRGGDRVPTDRDSRRIAFVGDSFVLGSGVSDGATLPDHLEILLNTKTEMKFTVFNAGKSGTSLVSFPGMVRYVRDKVKPALVIVRIGENDLSARDINTRILRAKGSFLYQLLVFSNFELVFELIHQRFLADSHQLSGETLLAAMDALHEAAAGVELLIVTSTDDNTIEIIGNWVRMNPDVAWVDLSHDSVAKSAAVISGDGHWTSSGNRTIATVLLEKAAQVFLKTKN